MSTLISFSKKKIKNIKSLTFLMSTVSSTQSKSDSKIKYPYSDVAKSRVELVVLICFNIDFFS
jgi:hypothetical protein